VVLQVHRQMTVVITVCVLFHPAVLMVWDTRFLGLLNIFTAPLRAKFAVISVLLLLVLIVTSTWRHKLRLSYQTWQVLHSVLATLIVVTALAHVLLIGYYVGQPWERALWIAYSAAFVGIGVWVRAVRPALRWRQRWQVVQVREQPGGHTIALELRDPNSYGPKGFQFRPGQFAWINAGRSPFSIEYHPFSISSSAERPGRVEFTIKTEKGFTTKVHDFAPGQDVYLDGPWGHFSMDRHEGPGFVFLGGGVGITPLLSMLATMADREDERPCWAIVGNRYENQMIGRDELDELTRRMKLTVVQVLSAPGDSWTGHRGRVDAALLDQVLPKSRNRLQYFLCGSEALMDGIEAALRQLGIPDDRVHSERFAMA
jgi:predicted ferric reductase